MAMQSRASPASIRRASGADHATALGVRVLLTKPSLRLSKMFGPTERWRYTLIASVDPRSIIELALVHRLASLLWRLRRACAIETGLSEVQGELLSPRRKTPSCGPSQLQAPGANGHSKDPSSNGRDDPPVSDQEQLSTTMRAAA